MYVQIMSILPTLIYTVLATVIYVWFAEHQGIILFQKYAGQIILKDCHVPWPLSSFCKCLGWSTSKSRTILHMHVVGLVFKSRYYVTHGPGPLLYVHQHNTHSANNKNISASLHQKLDSLLCQQHTISKVCMKVYFCLYSNTCMQSHNYVKTR